MATATSYNVSTIKVSGGDYTSLATWWAAEKGGGGSANVAAWAECYGWVDLNPVVISGAGYTSTSVYYSKIYAATTNRATGHESGGGAYCDVGNVVAIDISEHYTRVEGIRFLVSSDGTAARAIYIRGVTGCVFDGITIEVTALNAITSFIYAYFDAGGRTITLRNIILYGNNSATRANGLLVNCYGAATATASVQNCGVSQLSSHVDSVAIRFSASQGRTLTVTSTNNVVTGTGGDDYRETEATGGVVNVTQTYCLSSDATASTWGGAGNLINQTPADVWEDVATDLRLKADPDPDLDSPAIRAGTNLTGTFATDATGRTRPATGAWDMGPVMYAGRYYFYRGASLRACYAAAVADTPVGYALAGTTKHRLADLGHTPDKVYWYLIRAMSAYGVKETNTDEVLRVRVDTPGDLDGQPPNRISWAEATPAAAGKINFFFVYSADGELAAATTIEVARVTGGVADWGSLVDTITITGSTRRTVELSPTYADRETVHLAARAKTAAGDAGQAFLLRQVGADAAAPGHLEFVEASQA